MPELLADLWTDLPADAVAGTGLPSRIPSPFDELGPHPIARRAAEILMGELAAGRSADVSQCGGKMFGVLVVRGPDGRTGFLRAFSGTIEGRFELSGFVPPLFDANARAAIEPDGERVVSRLAARAVAFASSVELRNARALVAEISGRHHNERIALAQRHHVARNDRRKERALLALAAIDDERRAACLEELAQQSRRDKSERRRLDVAQRHERVQPDAALARLERRAAAHARLSAMVSRKVMRSIHDTYVLTNASGQARSLRALFAPGEPPSGAGDCAAPKLLATAFALGLQPLAMAEFWWGAPPPAGGRIAGAFYPACRDKCAPLLPFLMQGIDVAAPRLFTPPDASGLELPVVYEDEWIVVVDKPCGLLSAPSPASADSVPRRMAARGFGAVDPVHRLDMETSGLLLLARDAGSYRMLQRQFASRTVGKRYVAMIEGHVHESSGTIELRLRVDVDDRPRQIHDPVHGRYARTEWTVLHRATSRTRIAFVPRTGRTHQLRVHAAHPLGLGAPIVGDRLYGHEDARLMLHAAHLSFVHPASGERLSFDSPAPF